MKKKILALGPCYSVHTFKWLYPLKENFHVTLFSFHSTVNLHAKDLTSNIEIIELPRITKTKLDYFYMPFFLLVILFRNNFDIIISQYASSYGLLGAFFTPFKKKILIFWGSDFYKYQKSFLLRNSIRLITKMYDHIIVPSTAMKNDIFNKDSVDNKVSVFQYGVPWIEFNRLVSSKENINNVTKFISIRKWEELYNIRIIIAAFMEYSKIYPQDELYLTINSDSEYAVNLKNMVKGITQIKTFETLDTLNLYELIGKSHILISIPKSDGMPLSVLEAVSAGCFPILSNLPANIEILRHCEGVLIDDYSIKSLVNSMILAKNKICENIPAKNSTSIRQIADIEIAKLKTLQIVNQIIGSEK